MNTEQRRNLFSLLIAGPAFAAVLWIIFRGGAVSYFENDAMRGAVLTVIVAAGILWLLMMHLTRPSGADAEVIRDERDLEIASRSRRIGASAANVYMAFFALAVIELYWAEGSAPVVLFFFLVMSTIIVSLLATCIAMLVGYRRG